MTDKEKEKLTRISRLLDNNQVNDPELKAKLQAERDMLEEKAGKSTPAPKSKPMPKAKKAAAPKAAAPAPKAKKIKKAARKAKPVAKKIKKSVTKKTVAKAAPKKIKKSAVKKKAAQKLPRVIKRVKHLNGSTSIAKDKKIKALASGKRMSKAGNVYYEYRANRADLNRTKKLAKGGGVSDEKPLSYYKYSTPRVNMAWNGKIQQGGFYSAQEAMDAIKKQAQTEEELTHYSIVTPDKVIHLGREYTIRYAKGGGVGKKAKKIARPKSKRDTAKDKTIKALHAGKRTTDWGTTYVENRVNRSDKNRTKKFAKGGVVNGEYLDSISEEKKNKILRNIANHYDVSLSEAEEEVKDADAEMLYEYITNESLRMEVYKDLKNK